MNYNAGFPWGAGIFLYLVRRSAPNAKSDAPRRVIPKALAFASPESLHPEHGSDSPDRHQLSAFKAGRFSLIGGRLIAKLAESVYRKLI